MMKQITPVARRVNNVISLIIIVCGLAFLVYSSQMRQVTRSFLYFHAVAVMIFLVRRPQTLKKVLILCFLMLASIDVGRILP